MAERMKYFVETWDTYRQEFTPQKGVRTGPYSKWGLRKALRKLRAMGYPADRDDASVMVYREDGGCPPGHVIDATGQIVPGISQ